MASATKNQIKRELLNLIRNSNIIPTTTRGVTTINETISGDGVTNQFNLLNTGVKNIRSIEVDSVLLMLGLDYTFSEDVETHVTTITFVNTPTNGVDNIVINYDRSSSGDRIYPDFPKTVLSNESYPRIGFEIISGNSDNLDFQGDVARDQIVISFSAYALTRDATDDLLDELINILDSNKESLYYVNFIKKINDGPLLVIEGTNDKGFTRNVDYQLPFQFRC